MVLVGLSFLSTIQNVLTAIFVNILQPILTDVLNILLTTVGSLIADAMVKIVLQCWVVLLKLIAFFEDIFNIFVGLSDIRVNDVSQGMGFLDYLLTLSEIQQAVLAITLISFVLILFATILSVLRSMGDMPLEDKNPLSQVLRDSFKGALTVILVPTICLFALTVSSNLLLVIHNEFNLGLNDDADSSDLIFITVASSSIKNATKIDDYSSGHAYTDVDALVEDFYVSEFNYFLAFASALFVGFIFFTTVIQSIMRIFMILVLYLVSPLIAVMMPLDGGRKFNEWKKMFLAYTVSAFAPVLSMKLYFMVMASLFASSTPIVFSDSTILNTIIEVMLITGGAYAVYSSRNLLVTLIDPTVAGVIGASGGMLTRGLGMGMGKVTSFVSGGGGSPKQSQSQSKTQANANQTLEQRQTLSG